MANNNSNISSGVGDNSKEQIQQKKQRVRDNAGIDKKLDGPNRPAE